MYVLDEPSIGLHQRDNDRLIATLQHLRDMGNSVLVVEHDEDMMRAADHVIDMGPGAGVHGGRVMAQGTPTRCAPMPRSRSPASTCRARARIAVPKRRTPWLPVLDQPAARGRGQSQIALSANRGQQASRAAPSAWPSTTHARAPCRRCAWWAPRATT
jgi:excinuclease UvrABC ATPase subunit